MNVFLIPLQERISLSLLHPSSPSLSLTIFSYSISNFFTFLFSFATSIFCMLHFVFYCYVDNYFSCLTFIDLVALITFSVNFSIYPIILFLYLFILIDFHVRQSLGSLFIISFISFMIFHIFLCLPTSFFSFSNILFLSDVSRFSFHSPGVLRRD